MSFKHSLHCSSTCQVFANINVGSSTLSGSSLLLGGKRLCAKLQDASIQITPHRENQSLLLVQIANRGYSVLLQWNQEEKKRPRFISSPIEKATASEVF